MKAKNFWSFMMMLALTVSASYAQQEFTFTTSAANLGGIKAALDMPGLNGNPLAIIIATPLGNTETLNPHPIGAWYYSGKWYLVNLDSQRMSEGAKFKIQYFTQPSTKHFVHNILNSGAKSYIDHPELDNKPGIQVSIFQNHSPETRTPYYLNPSEARVAYEGGKWYIQNVNNTALHAGTAYNIIISPFSGAGSVIDTTNIDPTAKTPITYPSTSPTGNAGGDLSGAYPNPNVIGLNGNPLSNKSPEVGDILRWNGTAWEPYTSDTGQSGQVLTSNGTGVPPTWKQPTSTEGAGIQTYYRTAPASKWSPIVMGKTSSYIMPDITHNIVLAKKSRLVISARITIEGGTCVAFCGNPSGNFEILVNGAPYSGYDLEFEVPSNARVPYTVSNYMFDLNAGNYRIDFRVSGGHPNTIDSPTGIAVRERQSSIMVIPLE